jgi:hypothetical protein
MVPQRPPAAFSSSIRDETNGRRSQDGAAHPGFAGIGHQITARFWQDLKPTDLHWTLSEGYG